jgi:CubicO group peptidase (beta-lactamase class C family)
VSGGSPLTRRAVLRAGLLAGAALPAGCTSTGPAGTARPAAPPSTSLTVTPTLRTATAPAPYTSRLLDTVRRYLAPTRENPRHPTYAGAVALLAVDGEIRVHLATGDALRYDNGPVELPPSRRVAMHPDSIFDLASITKVFTALALLQQVERGRVELAAPVREYLPDFRGEGKAAVTVAMLLAHTSGLPVGVSLTGVTGRAAQRAAILGTPLLRGAVPGTVFRYSGLGLMVVGLLLEQVTGAPLAAVIRDGITTPLGLRETGFRPLDWLDPVDVADRVVATDARRQVRGLLRGVVHDSLAHAVGGVAGHAGLFGTARDLAVLAQALVNGGKYGGARVLAASTVDRMLVNANPGLPAVDPDRPGRSASHGLGVELDQPWFMGRLASPRTFGHTGFTGTSFLVDLNRRLILVLLTNRAHPDWTWANPDPARAAVADVVADST